MPRHPVMLKQISVTERSSFRECRRAWYFGNVRMLEPVIQKIYFWQGEGLHAALEVYHGRGGTLQLALDAYEVWYAKSIPKVAESYGGLWEGAVKEHENAHDLSVKMLINYDEFHRSQNDVWEPVAVEQRVWVTILNPATRRTMMGSPRLTARFDFLGAHKGRQRLIIVDHKSSSGSPSSGRDLDLDDQLTGYAYVYWRLTGELPEQIIYNVLIKATPKPPEILQSGLPSTAKGQATTYGVFLQTLTELQAAGKNVDMAKYAEVLNKLQHEGWSRYFSREGVTRNLAQIEMFEQHVYDEYRDMVEVIKDPRKAYPNPDPMRCMRCPFIIPCMAMEDGSDAESILKARFRYNPEERW